MDVILICMDCKAVIDDEEYLTEVNPAGGFGRPQVLVCDNCMRSGRWEHWKAEHWPTWPQQARGKARG